jgi:hypothetical protein
MPSLSISRAPFPPSSNVLVVSDDADTLCSFPILSLKLTVCFTFWGLELNAQLLLYSIYYSTAL